MSDTETELERETPPAAPKARQPRPSPATEPTAGAAKPEAVEKSPTQPDPPPTELSPAATVATQTPAAATPSPRRRRPQLHPFGFPWEVSPLAKFPMAELLAEIDRRHARAKVLLAERKRILAQMADLEAELGIAVGHSPAPAERGVAKPRPRRQRAKNSVSLADALAMAVEVRATVTPAEAAQLVLSNGCQSTAKSFGMVVANALNKDKRFRRIGRGRYERVAMQAGGTPTP